MPDFDKAPSTAAAYDTSAEIKPFATDGARESKIRALPEQQIGSLSVVVSADPKIVIINTELLYSSATTRVSGYAHTTTGGHANWGALCHLSAHLLRCSFPAPQSSIANRRDGLITCVGWALHALAWTTAAPQGSRCLELAMLPVRLQTYHIIIYHPIGMPSDHNGLPVRPRAVTVTTVPPAVQHNVDGLIY